jgi:hypothetical protein
MNIPSEILHEAIKYLDTHGWTQGNFEDEHGKVCAIGAFNRGSFCFNSSLTCSELVAARNRAYDAMVNNIPEDCSGIIGFNDNPSTTAEDVKLMFKKAIEEVENG